MRVIGLTGGIGVGKSTVAGLLAARGAQVIDVDGVARQVIEPGGAAHEAVLDRFGRQLLVDGRIDRAALGAIVFAEPAALGALTALSHPAANAVMAAQVAGAGPGTLVVLDMAVLVEYPKLGRWEGGGYDAVLLVQAPLEVRLERLESQRGMSREDALARMRAQASDEDRLAVATWVLDNGGDLTALEAEVERVWPALAPA